MVTSAQAADKIAMVNMNSLFQQVAQKTGVSNTLENEFKGRASSCSVWKAICSQNAASAVHETGCRSYQAGKDVMAQRQTFSQKAQSFEQDRARRSNEERGKLVNRIQTAVKSVASSQSIDRLLILMPLHTTAAM
ncbi:molecular chaperone [Raoultella planticola]|nr:molecular chaperone [Raoultella planticola]